MSADISSILSEWPYDADHTLRIVAAEDGRNVLQVRLPLGLEQYELDGRPDGTRPFGKESVLAEYERRKDEYVKLHGGDDGFSLTHEDFVLLQEEGVLNYYRYVLLFQINDFSRVLRDTDHNLRICDLVEKHVSSDEEKTSLLQYRPYILRMRRMSEAMTAVKAGNKEEALRIVKEAALEIGNLPELDSPVFQFEKIRSLNYLHSAAKQLAGVLKGPREELEAELEAAVREEDYELAAEIRDKIRSLER